MTASEDSGSDVRKIEFDCLGQLGFPQFSGALIAFIGQRDVSEIFRIRAIQPKSIFTQKHKCVGRYMNKVA